MTYVDAGEIREHLKGQVVHTPERRRITATPFVYRDPGEIPPRQMVYGRHFVRKFISGTLAPGGVGKSSNALVEAVAMATGRDLLGVVARQPLRVWYWGGEDPLDEIERRVAAILLHYDIQPFELADRLFIDSGRNCEIVIAQETRDGALIAEPVITDLEETIRENAIDVWILDPFVSCHQVSENDNNKIGGVMRELAMLADRTDSAGDLVHHVRKAGPGATEITVEDGRGAKAFSDRCRSVRTLNRMSPSEALEFAVPEDRVRLLFRIDIGKSNLFPPARAAVWRLLADVSLGNGGDQLPDDHVGVVTRWDPPSLFHGLTNADILRVQREIDRAGDYRESHLANRWVGKAVAVALDWDLTDASSRKRVGEMVKIWMRTKLLELVEETDEHRKSRTFVRVKKWIEL
jgi:hypothetical protein